MSMTESKREEILSDIRDGYIDEWDNLTIDELFKQIESEHNEIQQYRAIGTVERFRELEEKATAKKPTYQGTHAKCPSCFSFHVYEDYCSKCGQMIDWSEGKE